MSVIFHSSHSSFINMSATYISRATEMCKDHAIAKFTFVTFKLTSVSAYTTLSLLLLVTRRHTMALLCSVKVLRIPLKLVPTCRKVNKVKRHGSLTECIPHNSLHTLCAPFHAYKRVSHKGNNIIITSNNNKR